MLSSLADESPIVREASMSSLKDIASLNPLLVLDCCSFVSRGGRRRFGNMAGVFQVMAFGVRALDEKDVDYTFMAKLSKIATAEMIFSKELNADWQRAAVGLLVSISSHLLDLLIVVMASHCYLVGPSGELFIEYLVRHCALSHHESSKVMIGVVCPTELRAICEQGLLL